MADRHPVEPALAAATKKSVRRLRALGRDPKARRDEGLFLVEGPRAIEAALDRNAPLEQVLFGLGARRAFAPLATRLEALRVPVDDLREGALERIATTRTPQPVLAIASIRAAALVDIARDGHVVVVVDVADPGNAGTVLRSAEASGAAAVIFTGESVDAYNPKVVRASAGAIFGVPVVEEDDPVAVLDRLAATGRCRLGATPSGGTSYDQAALGGSAIVLGGEARGLGPAVTEQLDGTVSIPMAAATESLNVAMAATVLCFEAQRQRTAT